MYLVFCGTNDSQHLLYRLRPADCRNCGKERCHPGSRKLTSNRFYVLLRASGHVMSTITVDVEINNEPTLSGPSMSAVECLKNSSGDSGGQSRLLIALCRNRGIPARLVTGDIRQSLPHDWYAVDVKQSLLHLNAVTW